MADTTTKTAEVIDVTTVRPMIPRVMFAHTLQSPFFWFTAGAVASVAVYYFLIHKPRRFR